MTLHLSRKQAKALGIPAPGPSAKASGKRKAKQATAKPMAIPWERWGLPTPVAEFKFHLRRKWRFDWAFIDAKVAIECEGGAWTQGRHTRGKGFLDDMAKYNEGVLLGWRVFRCTPQEIESGAAMALIRRALGIEA